MRGFVLAHTKSYYLKHPLEFVKEVMHLLKYAWQRVYRGWDNTVAWDLSGYLCDLMPQILDRMIERGNGYPAHIAYDDCDEDCRRNILMSSRALTGTGGDEELDRALQNKWNSILQEIADGFRAASLLKDRDYAIDDKCYEEFEKRYPREKESWFEEIDGGFSRLVTNPNFLKLKKELRVEEERKREEEEAKQKWNRGMELFQKYFFDLWD